MNGSLVVATLWTADASVAIGIGATSDAARAALVSRHPQAAERADQIDYHDADPTPDGWAAHLDGN